MFVTNSESTDTEKVDEPPMSTSTLPTELWFDILRGLSRNDRRAFAGVCRTFFDILFSITRLARFVVDDSSTKQMFQASTWLLGRATEVHWSSIRSHPWSRVPNLSSNGQAPRVSSFEIMLPLLSRCGNLTSLALTGIIVSGEHQHAIYSLPHLRTITLRSARFHNTAIKMPKHNITHLRFSDVPSEVTLSYILRQTSSTLITLQVKEGSANAFTLDTPRCPHLTTFMYYSTQCLEKEVAAFLERHPNIRVICLNVGYAFRNLGSIYLPHLTNVAACMELGRVFLARPELTEFSQHPKDRKLSVRALWSWLAQVQRSQLHPPRLEQLRVAIWHDSDYLGALPVISHVFGGSLRKLHIYVADNARSSPSHSYSYLLGGWTKLKGPGPYSGSQATVELAHLRTICVLFRLIEGVDFPEAICKRLLKEGILPLCPELEEALFMAIPFHETIEQERTEDGMELRIRKKGHGWDLPLQK